MQGNELDPGIRVVSPSSSADSCRGGGFSRALRWRPAVSRSATAARSRELQRLAESCKRRDAHDARERLDASLAHPMEAGLCIDHSPRCRHRLPAPLMPARGRPVVRSFQPAAGAVSIRLMLPSSSYRSCVVGGGGGGAAVTVSGARAGGATAGAAALSGRRASAGGVGGVPGFHAFFRETVSRSRADSKIP